MKVLTFTTLFPNNVQPLAATFVRERMMRAKRHFELQVVAPVPWSPPLIANPRWSQFRGVELVEAIDGVPVYHPRYVITPKIGMCLYGGMLFASCNRFVRALRRSYRFELIDAHYLYPDGLAAVLLGRRLGVPVVLSARGSDVNLFPTFRLVRPWIQYAMREATAVISVSAALKRKMVRLGCPAEKIRVIPNAVDHGVFRPMDRAQARRQLGEALQGRMVLSVGNLKPEKGFRTLLEAFLLLRARDPDLRLRLIGDGPDRRYLAQRIATAGLEPATLVGAIPRQQISPWYSAANVFALASEAEGNPNVINESLACGTPVVTADLWEGDLPYTPEQGITAERLDAATFADATGRALSRDWDCTSIANGMRAYTWDDAAHQLVAVFSAALEKGK